VVAKLGKYFCKMDESRWYGNCLLAEIWTMDEAHQEVWVSAQEVDVFKKLFQGDRATSLLYRKHESKIVKDLCYTIMNERSSHGDGTKR